jgi:hypothetical protein
MALTKATNRMIEGASVNVKDFGAVGDGVTDDSPAIAAAFASIAGTVGEVYVPTGTFLLGAVIVVSNNLRGIGTFKASSTITGLSPDGRVGMLTANSSDVKIEGISFDCNSICGAIGVYGDNITIEGIKSNNSFRSHIFADQCDNFTISHCKLTNAGVGDAEYGDGIYTARTKNLLADGNVIDGFTRIGIVCEGDSTNNIYSEDPIIVNNNIQNGYYNGTSSGVQLAGIWTENALGGTVSNNVIISVVNDYIAWYSAGIQLGGVEPADTTVTRTAQANNNFIKDTWIGISTGNGSVVSNTKLHNVKTGIYVQSGSLNQNPIIINTHFDNCVFDADSTFPAVSQYNHCMFLVFGVFETVTIDGITSNDITIDSSVGKAELFAHIQHPVDSTSFPTYDIDEEFEIKNVAFPLITRVAELIPSPIKLTFTDVVVSQDLGSLYYAYELQFRHCTFDYGVPVISQVRGNKITFSDCTGSTDGQIIPISGILDFYMSNCVITDKQLYFVSGANIYASNNVFRDQTKTVFLGYTSAAITGSFNGNGLIDSGTQKLVHMKHAGDSIVLNANYRNTTGALVQNDSTGTLVENNTVVI